MRRYTPVGKTVAEKIRDLVNEATATQKYTVGTIDGFDLGVWPNDDIGEVLQEYQFQKDSEWEPDGPLGHDPQYVVPLNEPETERLINAAVGVQNRSSR
ncbi:MAG: hypothetical protein NUV60_03570 [Patescibacteria group bacterium]|nr:hypothetical protein [Patescibacteria group bacterium]